MSIRSLRPNVTREEALAMLGRKSVGSAARDLIAGPLRSIGEFYIPLPLYRAESGNAGRKEERYCAADGFHGSLDLYTFDARPSAEQVLEVDSRNVLPRKLQGAELEQVLRGKLERVLFQTGFFKMHG